MNSENLIARRNAVLGTGAPLFYEDPVHIVRGEGVWVTDAEGRKYLDMYNNVPCVGHAHPHVVAAMQTQAATLNVHSRYLHEGVVQYAERLMHKHDPSIDCVVFTCSGTEASEVALQMARAVTGGVGIVCTDAAYHGNSTEVRKLSRRRMTNDADNASVRAFPFPEKFRPLDKATSEDALTDLYLDELQRVIDGFKADAIPFAGLMLCSLLANEGLPDIPAGFMSRAVELVHQAGGVVIADEVQAGFCRTGSWWGYEVTNFVPDIVTMGKPMGNGMPIAATAARRELVNTFREKTAYFNTFASSPLQAAVGMAVLDVIENEQLAENAARVGAYLREQLSVIGSEHDQIGDVRGHGLFGAVEWVTPSADGTLEPDADGAQSLVNQLRQKGFLLGNAGCFRNVLKIRPPLPFSMDNADLFLTAFSEVLRDNRDK